MSRRERHARDSHDNRLRSRIDREPSPKKPRKDEKPEIISTRPGHRLSSSASRDKKQRPAEESSLPAPVKTPLAPTMSGLQSEKKNLERKGDRAHLSYYQHDDRSGDGRNFGRRAIDNKRWDDSREHIWGRNEVNTDPKKDERPQSHAEEKTNTWRHDRFHELESAAALPARKRPAFREKKIPSELQADPVATLFDKAALPSAREQPASVAARREERAPLSRADDKRDRRGDGFNFHYRNAEQSSERCAGLRGLGDRFIIGQRESNRADGFKVDKWKHDLFDEANRSPPRKNEEEQIAKVEALLAL